MRRNRFDRKFRGNEIIEEWRACGIRCANAANFLVARKELCYSSDCSQSVVPHLGSNRSGRSAAWLARLVRDQEVEGSNPFAPTIFLR
jgi:hypothetical protein